MAVVAVWLAAPLAIPQSLPEDEDFYEIDGRRSGYLYLEEPTQILQDDDFLNPGFFAIERGRELWRRIEGAERTSCATCHGNAEEAMRGVAARYPMYDSEIGEMVNLEGRINQMRSEYMGAEPLPYESDELLALTTFVALQSRGMPLSVEIGGPARRYFERGRAFYFRRRGQLDLACADCHDDLEGRKLRGDVLSQGQINGFPVYRLLWDEIGSRHRMFAWCNTSLRAEPYSPGSEEYLSLELYVAWRGRGLPIETPAVRR